MGSPRLHLRHRRARALHHRWLWRSLFCNTIGGSPPATLAKLTLGVSLVDGYNLPISITPFKGSGKCSYEGCVSDLNTICLVDLLVCSCNNKHVVACKIRKLSLSVSFIYSRSLNAYSTIMRQVFAYDLIWFVKMGRSIQSFSGYNQFCSICFLHTGRSWSTLDWDWSQHSKEWYY